VPLLARRCDCCRVDRHAAHTSKSPADAGREAMPHRQHDRKGRRRLTPRAVVARERALGRERALSDVTRRRMRGRGSPMSLICASQCGLDAVWSPYDVSRLCVHTFISARATRGMMWQLDVGP
jgi:hypothetical protein